MLGTRDVTKLTDWQKENPGGKAGSFADAAGFGDVVVLATLGTATVDAVRQAGVDRFADKVVIDAANPLRSGDAGPQLAIGFDDSLGEQVQRAIPQARVVKAFNTVGAPYMIDPKFEGGPPTMFVAGNDDRAKQFVSEILRNFGWDVADLGGIEASRYLEPMCMAWVAYGARTSTWHHAFKLLR